MANIVKYCSSHHLGVMEDDYQFGSSESSGIEGPPVIAAAKVLFKAPSVCRAVVHGQAIERSTCVLGVSKGATHF